MRRNWLVILAGLAGLLFVALPLIGLVVQAPWSSARQILDSPDVRQALILSLTCSTAAAAIALVLGTPVAWLLADPTMRGRNVMRGLCALALVLPPVVSGIALLAAFSPEGIVGKPLYEWFGLQFTFSVWGTVMAQSFVAFPFVVLTLESAFRTVDPRTLDAARSFGAGPWMRFRTIVVPAVLPSMLAGAVLAWARALGEFGATITFAGNLPGKTQTLPLAIYQLQDSDPGAAIMLSLLLVAIALAVIILLKDRWTGVFR